MKKPTSFTLNEIAEWDEKQKVSLPTVQRGFVWKPYQIENLWDSLLRGYPVGSFVLSPAEKNTFHILDGQQRATAICLGFAKETFRDSQDFYKVFIDLELPKPEDNREFIFRVITASHRWGYSRNENSKPLSIESIRKALDIYKINDPFNAPLEKFFPFDAILPVPFHYFLNGALQKSSGEILYETIKKDFTHWETIVNKWRSDNAKELIGKTEHDIQLNILNKISTIYAHVIEMLDEQEGQKIPALYLNLDRMLNVNHQNASNYKNNGADEIENLFVRLNSGGTQLSGEELNYSILKARLSGAVQNEIENACMQLFKPARFITIAFRLFQQENKETQQSDALTMRIKPKQFQNMVSADVNKFEAFILDIIRSKKFNNKTLLDYTQSVLQFESVKQPYGLPFLIYSKIADTAPELMFLLLFRIKMKGDRFIPNIKEKNVHRKMLGIITLFMWFGKGENLKDHSKLLTNIWPAATTLDQERFWSSESVQRAHLNDVLPPFPAYHNSHENGLERILEYKITEKINIIYKFENDAGKAYKSFLEKFIANKDLLLYAQKHFIEVYFKQRQYRLEDTSLPFDWDHISPNKLVRNKQNIPYTAKYWYNTNGNFRAWPYELNRMDSDNSPANKLNPFGNMDVTEQGYNDLKMKWEKFISLKSTLISNIDQIPVKLTEWSFCDNEWLKCNVVNMKTDWKTVTKLIVHRNIKLIHHWYEELNIEDLRKESKISIEDLFDKRKWKKLPLNNSRINTDLDESVNWISTSFDIGDTQLNFYFTYPDGEGSYYEVNKIDFGLFDVAGNNFISKMKNKDDYDIDNQNFKWINGNFTLVSGHIDSYKKLLNDITEWLRKLPLSSKDKNLLVNKFKDMLSTNFKITA